MYKEQIVNFQSVFFFFSCCSCTNNPILNERIKKDKESNFWLFFKSLFLNISKSAHNRVKLATKEVFTSKHNTRKYSGRVKIRLSGERVVFKNKQCTL
jgi:hypothetical protein